ncbi:MAG TPA: hypothetical protein VG755_10855 [Nannocystaceae bacterium]|nr:hypothetical protein [Nannocystaceae bacterium]
MRICGALFLALLTSWSRQAQAHPMDPPAFVVLAPEPTSSKAPGNPGVTPDSGDTAVPEPSGPEPTSSPAGPQPTSSRAPDSATDVPDMPSDDPTAVEPKTAPSSSSTLEEQRGHARSRDFNRHGVGIRGGILVVPTWILSRYLDAHGNALCRGEKIGNFAAKHGLLKTQGCNFYIAAEYVYRQSRILDIVPAIGYMRLHTPDAMWLDKGQFAIKTAQGLNGNSGADYTEVKMNLMTMQVDFIARAPIVVRDDVEFGLGGGGGLGLGVVFGGVWQTALSDAPGTQGPRGYANGTETDNSCQTIDDLADFTKCTPHYDADESGADPNFDPANLSHPGPNNDGYAHCSKDRCDTGDLNAFGYRHKNSSIPPVIPIVNLALSARVIIKDAFGITLTGGWNTGFYFGGSLNYFFGKSFQKHGRTGPAPTN